MHRRLVAPSGAGHLLTLLLLVVAGVVILATGWVGYSALAFARYGHASRPIERDTLLDRYMPQYEAALEQLVTTQAPPATVYAAACAANLRQVEALRAVDHVNQWLGSPRKAPLSVRQLLRSGWVVLTEVPGQEIIVGTAANLWGDTVVYRRLSPDQFAAFDSSGYAKIVVAVAVSPEDPGETTLRLVTRVQTTDPASSDRVRRTWSTYYPGILLVRRQAARLIRDAAESAKSPPSWSTCEGSAPAAPAPREPEARGSGAPATPAPRAPDARAPGAPATPPASGR